MFVPHDTVCECPLSTEVYVESYMNIQNGKQMKSNKGCYVWNKNKNDCYKKFEIRQKSYDPSPYDYVTFIYLHIHVVKPVFTWSCACVIFYADY